MRTDESSNRVPSHKSVGLLADTSDGGTCLVLRLERQYNLGVIFTEGPDGTFLSEVDVRLRRHDKVLAAIQATGPRACSSCRPTTVWKPPARNVRNT